MRSQWQAELAAQSEARVQALQARIRPHFLFNSLNTIASLIEVQPAVAERATEDLADLFRGSMRQADTMIPLSEELELARKYLDMEQRRLGDRLQTEWTVESFPDDVFVLPLILQPLLENAVTHGVQPHENGGLLKMYASSGPESIIITISNPKAPAPDYQAGNAGDHGMALENIRARLELAFAEGASLLTHEDQNRFYAVLTIPYDSNPDHR
jgi:two-component system sensor histidine kinase AlgZ